MSRVAKSNFWQSSRAITLHLNLKQNINVEGGIEGFLLKCRHGSPQVTAPVSYTSGRRSGRKLPISNDMSHSSGPTNETSDEARGARPEAMG